jgi:hypothetical protein
MMFVDTKQIKKRLSGQGFCLGSYQLSSITLVQMSHEPEHPLLQNDSLQHLAHIYGQAMLPYPHE